MANTVASITASLRRPTYTPLPAPEYVGPDEDQIQHVGLAVESMKRHMTDEGWQLFAGLERAGYELCGFNIPYFAGDTVGMTDVNRILDDAHPRVVVMQDKREWEGLTADRSRDPRMAFRNVTTLRSRSDVFKLTVLKDAQNAPGYHRTSADEIGCHAWIVYYHPDIVSHVAPYVRRNHLVRTYHTVDRDVVPTYDPESPFRKGCVISGAISNVYPLRMRLVGDRTRIPDLTVMRHPGYHRHGCDTPKYLRDLSTFKVAICTSSIYGYALRKIVEATACGCVVLTDLPADDCLPAIDANLVRIDARWSTDQIASLVRQLIRDYNPHKQKEFAEAAILRYDYRNECMRLAAAIEQLRTTYNGE